jgi:hypothetical protein
MAESKHEQQQSGIKAGAPSASRGLLQRKCACGQHTIAGGECGECNKNGQTIQRATGHSELGTLNSGAAPQIVHDVLRSSGQPLDATTRAFMEPRFGHDFSRVRVHTDGPAAESARAVNALAYTVASDVVFADGKYAPQSATGRRILAHELTHVVQQNGPAIQPLRESMEVSDKESVFEKEADAVSDSIMNGGATSLIRSEAPTLRKQAAMEVELAPVSPAEDKRLKGMGINLPTVGPETWRAIGGVADNAGKSLSQPEKTKIQQLLEKAKLPAAVPLASVQGAKFLLHDTSAELGAGKLKEEKDKGRGPMGAGVSAWVPRDADATIARPNFYESKRPSTTEFEKGIDIIKQADRETALKEVWKVTSAAAKSSALDTALKDQGLTPDEINNIKAGAEAFLKGVATKIDGAKTTAAWAVGEICAALKSKGSGAVAESGKEKELEAACKKLDKYFADRPARASSMVTVEIVQVGVKSDQGSANTCNPDNPNVKPIPNPPYSDTQYANIALIYLRAALTAGTFPEITTHFVVDAFDRGHCDPRCFDLMKLYDTIAASLGHGKGSTYGVAPKFGRTWGKDTIWWSDKICGKGPP